jgi:hypothetical protein
MSMKVKILWMALMGCLAAGAWADGSASTTSEGLKIPRGARATALGGAYLALADGADAMLWNPAGLTALRDLQIQASHLSYLEGVNDEWAALALPLYNLGAAVGLGATYLYTSDVSRDAFGARGQDFTDFDFSLQTSYAMDFFRHFSAGATYKILRQGYGGNFAMGSGFDLGAQARRLFGGDFTLALGAFNLGTPMAIGTVVSNLPITLKAGLAWKPGPDWALETDYSHQPIDFINRWHFGAEKAWRGERVSLTLRAGYALGPERDLGGLTGLAAGAGLGLGAWQLDYAWAPAGDFGDTQRLSLTYSFGSY